MSCHYITAPDCDEAWTVQSAKWRVMGLMRGYSARWMLTLSVRHRVQIDPRDGLATSCVSVGSFPEGSSLISLYFSCLIQVSGLSYLFHLTTLTHLAEFYKFRDCIDFVIYT